MLVPAGEDTAGINRSRQIKALVLYGRELCAALLSQPEAIASLTTVVGDGTPQTGGLSLCVADPEPAPIAERLRNAGISSVTTLELDADDPAQAVRPGPEAAAILQEHCDTNAAHIAVLHDGRLSHLPVSDSGPRLVEITPETRAKIDIETLLHTGRPTPLNKEPWAVVEEDPGSRPAGHWETVLGLTNGYLGCRATHEEYGCGLRQYGATFVNGVRSRKPYEHPVAFPGFATHYQGIVNVGEWRLFDVLESGEAVNPLDAEHLRSYDRRLDLRTGCVTRTLVVSHNGAELEIRSTWFVSSARPHVAAARYAVTTRHTGTERLYELSATLVREPVSNAFDEPRVHVIREGSEQLAAADGADGGRLEWHLLSVEQSEQIVAVAVYTTFIGTEQPHEYTTAQGAVARAAIAGDGSEVRRILCIRDGVRGEEDALVEKCLDELRGCARIGYSGLISEHTSNWESTWDRIGVSVNGPDADRQALRYALFQLHSHAPTRDGHSIPATGLVGDGYGGHIFWDTEIYMLPFFNLTNPHLARHALMYRYHLLPKARKRAREMDGRGALFAWNTIDGDECGVVFEASTAQYHLNCAIAYALWQHYQVTGDERFIRDVATPIVWETAIFLSHLGAFIPERDGAFCLNVVCGPDEYACGVDNNAYFNYMTHWHFGLALRLLERWTAEAPAACDRLRREAGLDQAEVARLRKAHAAMYLPQPNADGIIPQDDSYLSRNPVEMRLIAHNTDIRDLMHPLNLWRIQVTKQADVVLLFLLRPDLFDGATRKINYDFYEARTNHGSSLSPAVHSIIANEIGYRIAAYRYFSHSARLDLDDFKRNAWKGLHTACLGGTWLAAIAGFGGMRITDEGLALNPRLPDAWESLEFPLTYRGAQVCVRCTHRGIRIQLRAGERIRLTVHGEPIVLTPERCTWESASDGGSAAGELPPE